MTPEAALAIGPDDRLLLAAPPNTGRPQISGVQAGAFAVSLAKYYLPYTNTHWDSERGKPVDYQKLAVCGSPLYASSPFERLEIDDPAARAVPLQKALGPLWLVNLCGPSGPPQLHIAVSAYSTDLRLDASGVIEFPPVSGGDFFPEAVPISGLSEELPSAEAAVVLSAALTGRRVAAAPELIAPFYINESPYGSRWRITLDRPVRLRATSGESIETSEIFIRRTRLAQPVSQLWGPTPVQPESVDVVYIPQSRVGEDYNAYLARRAAETRTLHVRRLPNMPISFLAGGILP